MTGCLWVKSAATNFLYSRAIPAQTGTLASNKPELPKAKKVTKLGAIVKHDNVGSPETGRNY